MLKTPASFCLPQRRVAFLVGRNSNTADL